MTEGEHIPVLVDEILQELKPSGEERLLDGTLGLGGHTKAYLEHGGEKTSAVGIEADEKALQKAKENLSGFKDRVTFIQGNYYEIKDFTTGGGILYPPKFSHILLDLGIGSHQLSDTSRGFSFQAGSALTMKFGPTRKLPPAELDVLNELETKLQAYPDASDIIHRLDERSLANVIRHYGEERLAYRVASAIVDSRQKNPIVSAAQLADIIRQALPKGYEKGRIDPATRTFQALRLAVNRELEVLRESLPQLIELLAPQGKIAVISFHSLEDRIVKTFFRQEEKGCICPPENPMCVCGKNPRLKVVTKKPITATEEEIARNPRARSAKLRIATRAPDSA